VARVGCEMVQPFRTDGAHATDQPKDSAKVQDGPDTESMKDAHHHDAQNHLCEWDVSDVECPAGLVL